MSLGALITKSRTAARLSIEDLAKSTNIPATLLRDMENDNFKKCGGETYARGHLRNIAAKLGIDERVFLDLFESEISAPVKPIRDLLNENNVTMPYQEPKRVSWKVLAVGALAVLLFVGVAQIIFSNITDGKDSVVAASPTASASKTATPKPVASPESTEAAQVVSGKVSVEVVASRGATWLYVTNENGTSLFSGQIPKGGRKTFTDTNQVNLRVGNAGGVDLSVNGKSVGPIGANGEVVNLTYNAG